MPYNPPQGGCARSDEDAVDLSDPRDLLPAHRALLLHPEARVDALLAEHVPARRCVGLLERTHAYAALGLLLLLRRSLRRRRGDRVIATHREC